MNKRLCSTFACAVVIGVTSWSSLPSAAMEANRAGSEPGIGAMPGGQAALDKAEVTPKLAKLRMPFIINQGQTDKRVKFYAHTFGGTVFVTEGGKLIYSLPKLEEQPLKEKEEVKRFNSKLGTQNAKPTKGVVLGEEPVGGRASDISGEGEAITKVSYFKGNDQSKWKSNIPTYDLVSLGEIYKGVEKWPHSLRQNSLIDK